LTPIASKLAPTEAKFQIDENLEMKKYFAALTATALIGLAPHTLAASSTDLSVTGSIIPSACLPTLSEGGVVEYGKISSKDLNQTTGTYLEKRTVILSVKCDAPQRFALKGVDNRLGSSNLASAFGLGKINGSQNLGHFMVSMFNAVADGVSVLPIKSKDGQTGWEGHVFWMPGDYASVADRSDTSQPILVQDVAMELDIAPFILRADGLDLTNEVQIDGSATLEMNYL
jgi:type 1 fimbria pilin